MNKYGIKNYEELITRSTDNLEWFWDAVIKDLDIEWYEPYKKILDTSHGIQWTKWFIDGKTNIVHNCLDRHAKSDKKDNIAVIWENENGDAKKLTYDELYKKVATEIYKGAPDVFMAHPIASIAARSNLKNIFIHPSHWVPLHNVYFE